jgi:hypothetical protein
MVPLKGEFENNQGHVVGNVTHFGKLEQIGGPPFIWKGANEDSVTVEYRFVYRDDIGPGLVKYKLRFTIVDGTGRFENATGSGVAYGTANLIENRRWGTIDGMISRPGNGSK